MSASAVPSRSRTKWRAWTILPLMFASGLYAYHRYLEPAVVNRYATCHFTKNDGPVTHTIQLWFAKECRWPGRTQHILPASFIVGALFIFLLGRFVVDWYYGPPGWAVDLAAFGFGALGAIIVGTVVIGGWVWYLIGYAHKHPGESWEQSPGDIKILFFVLSVFFYLVVPCLCIALGARLTNMLSSSSGRRPVGHLRGAMTAPVAFFGSVVGVVVGTSIAGLLILVAFYALLIVALYYAMMIVFGALFVAIVASALG